MGLQDIIHACEFNRRPPAGISLLNIDQTGPAENTFAMNVHAGGKSPSGRDDHQTPAGEPALFPRRSCAQSYFP